jgi:hypothetical protein
MAHSSRQIFIVRDAIDNILRRRSALPPSAEVDELRAKADRCEREADAWNTSPAEDRERLTKVVHKLHVEVATLERPKPGAQATTSLDRPSGGGTTEGGGTPE